MLLIYDDQRVWEKLSQGEQRQIFGEHGQCTQEIKEGGQYVGGAQLHPTSAATSVRMRSGKRLVTGGPFAETHEQLGCTSRRKPKIVHGETGGWAPAVRPPVLSANTYQTNFSPS